MWPLGRVVGGVADLEQSRIGALDLEHQRSLEDVDHLFAFMPAVLREFRARLEHEQHRHHRPSCVRSEQIDVDPFRRGMDQALLMSAHDLGVTHLVAAEELRE